MSRHLNFNRDVTRLDILADFLSTAIACENGQISRYIFVLQITDYAAHYDTNVK